MSRACVWRWFADRWSEVVWPPRCFPTHSLTPTCQTSLPATPTRQTDRLFSTLLMTRWGIFASKGNCYECTKESAFTPNHRCFLPFPFSGIATFIIIISFWRVAQGIWDQQNQHFFGTGGSPLYAQHQPSSFWLPICCHKKQHCLMVWALETNQPISFTKYSHTTTRSNVPSRGTIFCFNSWKNYCLQFYHLVTLTIENLFKEFSQRVNMFTRPPHWNDDLHCKPVWLWQDLLLHFFFALSCISLLIIFHDF